MTPRTLFASATPFAFLAALALTEVGCKAQVARARAASDFNCPEDSLEVEEIPGAAFRISGCGQHAVYSCGGGVGAVSNFGYGPNAGPGITNQEIVCTREAVPPDEVAPRKASAQPKADPKEGTGLPATGTFPAGAAGFDFGISREAAQTVCTDASHSFAEGADDDTRTCDKPAKSIGFDASIELAFCADALCRVDILTHAGADGGWTQRFLELRAALEERYGRPTTTRSVLPRECVTTLSACLVEGTVGFWVSWKWSAGEVITLAMGKREGKPVIRVSYERPSARPRPAL